MKDTVTRLSTETSTVGRIASRLLAQQLTIEDISRNQGKYYTKVYGIGEMGDWVEP